MPICAFSSPARHRAPPASVRAAQARPPAPCHGPAAPGQHPSRPFHGLRRRGDTEIGGVTGVEQEVEKEQSANVIPAASKTTTLCMSAAADRASSSGGIVVRSISPCAPTTQCRPRAGRPGCSRWRFLQSPIGGPRLIPAAGPARRDQPAADSGRGPVTVVEHAPDRHLGQPRSPQTIESLKMRRPSS